MKTGFIVRACLIGVLFAALTRPVSAEAITVYTAYETDEAEAFLRIAKEDMPDLEVRLVRLSTGELTRRVLDEIAHPQHDVIWGQAVTNLVDPRILATLEPYDPDSIDRLPARFRDPAGRWFAATGYMAAFCVNQSRLAQRRIPMPTSWADLMKPDYRGEVVMPDPTTSGTGYMQIVSILQQKGEQAGWAELKAIDRNVVRYEKSGSQPCNDAASGQYAVGASLAVRAIRNISHKDPIIMVIPKEGAANELEGNGLTASSQNKPAAKRFLDWTLSERAVREYYEWKDIVTAQGGYMPVSFRRAGMPADIATVMYRMDFESAGRDRADILRRWQKEFGR